MSLILDLVSICSILGIWPRYIEPRMVKTTRLKWELNPAASHLAGLKILHFSDLHFHAGTSQKFLDKIVRNISNLQPDIILFTGDFLCYSQLEEEERLFSFLNRLQAPLGSFCIFGNHDYARYVSRNAKGLYDLAPPPNPVAGVVKGLKALFSPSSLRNGVTNQAMGVGLHEQLCKLLRKTSFKLLENATSTLPIGLNITGLGDLALGRCRPETAYAGYDPHYPGFTLAHNPDSLPLLLNCPGDWILSGHTHGEQIHLPWPKWGRKLSKKLARLENPDYTRGLFCIGSKQLYVNRGLGCHKPFRLFSVPEITVIEAVKK